MRPWHSLLGAMLGSLLLYAALFGWLLDRPLELGYLSHQLDLRLVRAATIHQPKLVILAGSNGPYSHRCQLIEAMLDLPCVNGGLAVGIGLDYLFARWRNKLHPGDVVYMPMEQEQYTRGRFVGALGPDAAIMARHDWRTLVQLSPRRWAAAFFAFDLRSALMSVVEMSLVAIGFHDPRAASNGTINAWGDHVGHTAGKGKTTPDAIRALQAASASPAAIRTGYGSALIGAFVTWARVHGIRVIGGLPTELDERKLPPETQAAMAAVYYEHGGEFLALPNLSRYPVAAFFDTPLHLTEEAQIAHSLLVARALGAMLGRPEHATALAQVPHW